MYLVRNLILYFFLLILEVLFNLALDTVYKCNRFSKTLLEKGFEFVLEEGLLNLILLVSYIAAMRS